MESQWQVYRMRLYILWRDHPTWILQQLADVLNYSVSWVKKWLHRFREASHKSLTMFQGQSRTPKQRPHSVVDPVCRAILSLSELYGRVVGPKTILYHLHQDSVLKDKDGIYRAPRARSIASSKTVAGYQPRCESPVAKKLSCSGIP